jgi:beta-lysine N6-acetyltransferase
MNGLKEGGEMQDRLEILGTKTLVQHGDLNKRIYLMKLAGNDFPEVMEDIDQLANKNNYSKIFCKVPSWASPMLISMGYFTEAIVPLFFKGEVDGFFMSKITNMDRYRELEHDQLNQLHQVLMVEGNGIPQQIPYNPNYTVKELLPNDAEAMCSIFDRVFESYPFPIHDPDYVKRIMADHVRFFGVFENETLIAVSSAEMDEANLNVEMTDFAILQEYRGKRISALLLNAMEKAMERSGIKCFYTIARLNSIPMNKTFLRLGYKYAGTLIKNTNIAGKIESMTVLYKHV